MKRLLLPALLLGTVSVARAQISAPPVTIDRGNVAQAFSATSAAKATLLSDLVSADTFSSVPVKSANTFASPVVATALALPLDAAEPASPPPRPKFLYRGPYYHRWEFVLAAPCVRLPPYVFH